MRKLAIVVVAVLAVLVPAGAAQAKAAKPPQYVFVIVLENEDADTTFGPASPAPYLAQTLTAQGAFVPGYYGIGHNSLDNYIAMVSGQAPNIATQADCPVFTDFLPGTPASDGQVVGQGCVYPARVRTVADQLEARGLSWKG
jgi:phosphatidylinositol-3-phosphatase